MYDTFLLYLIMKKFLFLYLLLTTLITVSILYPYSVRIASNLPNAIDPVFYAWNVGHNIQSLAHGGKNLLDTNIFYPEGNTLALSDTLIAQTVLAAPILLLTQNPVLAENLYILSTFVIAAVAMFCLSYNLTRHKAASACSGIFFAFAVPRIAQIGHMPALSSQWLPLFVLFLLKYLETGTWRDLWWTFLFYLLTITSTIYFGIFLIPVAAVALLVKGIRWKGIKTLAVSLLPMLVILIIVLFPYIRLRAEYPGIKRGIDDAARLAAKIADYRTVLPTSWLSDLGMRTATNEEPLYPTLTLALLAATGVWLGWKTQRSYIIFFCLSGLTAFLLSLGPYVDILMGKYQWFHVTAPYYYLYHVFPLLQIVRVPARFSIIVVLSLAGLAAIGLSKLLSKKNVYTASVLVLLLYFTEVWQVGAPSVSVPTAGNIPEVYRWLADQPDDAIVAELPFRPLWTDEPMDVQLMHTYQETKDNNGYALETYRVYFSYFHRKRILNGYSSYFPQVYQDHATKLSNFPTADSIDMLQKEGVRYIVVHGGQYTSPSFTYVERQLARFASLKKVAQFGRDYVYEIH